jgi:hypothetical protein
VAGYQFIHVDSFARSTGKGKAGGHTIRSIANEADRIEGNFPHVQTPQAPQILYGVSANKAADLSEEWAEESKDPTGRKIRKDGLCLLAGVISYPNEGQNWEDFRADSVNWLKKKYGECLKSVIEHTDESHKHIHFYCVPKKGARFESIHEGRLASNTARLEGKLKGQQNTAYKEAMKAFQDQFSEEVGMSNALTRLGPGKRRLTREGWQKEKQQALYFANARAQHKNVRKKAQKQGYAEGIAKAQTELEATNKAFSHVGSALSSFAKGIIGDWHKPTSDLKRNAKKEEAIFIAAEAERIKKAKEAVEKAENEVKRTKAAHEKEVERLKRIIDSANVDLARYELKEKALIISPTKPKKYTY